MRDPAGNPVAGACLDVLSPEAPIPVGVAAVSDGAGRFTLSGLSPGTHAVILAGFVADCAPGAGLVALSDEARPHHTYTVSFLLEAGQVATKDFVLVPASQYWALVDLYSRWSDQDGGTFDYHLAVLKPRGAPEFPFSTRVRVGSGVYFQRTGTWTPDGLYRAGGGAGLPTLGSCTKPQSVDLEVTLEIPGQGPRTWTYTSAPDTSGASRCRIRPTTLSGWPDTSRLRTGRANVVVTISVTPAGRRQVTLQRRDCADSCRWTPVFTAWTDAEGRRAVKLKATREGSTYRLHVPPTDGQRGHRSDAVTVIRR